MDSGAWSKIDTTPGWFSGWMEDGEHLRIHRGGDQFYRVSAEGGELVPMPQEGPRITDRASLSDGSLVYRVEDHTLSERPIYLRRPGEQKGVEIPGSQGLTGHLQTHGMYLVVGTQKDFASAPSLVIFNLK